MAWQFGHDLVHRQSSGPEWLWLRLWQRLWRWLIPQHRAAPMAAPDSKSHKLRAPKLQVPNSRRSHSGREIIKCWPKRIALTSVAAAAALAYCSEKLLLIELYVAPGKLRFGQRSTSCSLSQWVALQHRPLTY